MACPSTADGVPKARQGPGSHQKSHLAKPRALTTLKSSCRRQTLMKENTTAIPRVFPEDPSPCASAPAT